MKLMNLKEEFKARLISALSEDTYKVSHSGHPDAGTDSSLSHLAPGKTYVNHVTKYRDSAIKTAAMLKKNGFSGVQIHKNGEVLSESIVSDAHNSKMAELTKQGYKPHSLGHETGVGVESHIMKHGETGKKIHVKTWRKSNSDVGQKVEPLNEAFKSKIRRVKEEITVEKDTLEEGKMGELSADIGDHMDKHIANYRKVGGAESLMAHAAKATHKIATMHGIEHKHAEKFVSDYIDSKLHEGTMNESDNDSLTENIKQRLLETKTSYADKSFDEWHSKAKGYSQNPQKVVKVSDTLYHRVTGAGEIAGMYDTKNSKNRWLKSFNVGRGPG